jgi:DNA-binding transcriptional LysR family regulator
MPRPIRSEKLKRGEMEKMLKLLNSIISQKEMSTTAIARQSGLNQSELTELRELLNSKFGAPTIEASRGMTFGRVNGHGEKVRERLRQILTLIDELESLSQSSFVNVGVSAAIMLNVLPGAVAAFNLLAQRLFQHGQVEVTLTQCNHGEILEGVTDGRFHLGIGWSPDWDLEGNIAASCYLFGDGVPYTVMTPCRAIYESPFAAPRFVQFMADLHKHEEGIGMEALCAAVAKNKCRIAALRSEPSIELRKLVPYTDPTRIIWVERYDDALAAVRAQVVDVAIAPAWYGRRPYVENKPLTNDDSTPFLRKIAVFERKNRNDGDTNPIDTFKEVIAAFCEEFADRILYSAASNQSGVMDKSKPSGISPEDVVEWVEGYLN